MNFSELVPFVSLNKTVKNKVSVDRHFDIRGVGGGVGWGKKSLISLEGSKSLLVRPSGRNSIKIKMYVEEEF